MTQLRKPHAHLTSICFLVPGSETSPILLKFLRFSAQILGFSADFHRKSQDIVKQQPMPKYGLIVCLSPIVGVNIGEHKFDGTGSAKIGSWKREKKRVLAIQRVGKTGNIGKKLQWQVISIM